MNSRIAPGWELAGDVAYPTSGSCQNSLGVSLKHIQYPLLILGNESPRWLPRERKQDNFPNFFYTSALQSPLRRDVDRLGFGTGLASIKWHLN